MFLLGLASLVGVQAYLRMNPRNAQTPERAEPIAAVVNREEGPLRVVVSIPPLMWPVKRMVPADSEVTLLIAPGSSEHGTELTASQVSAIYQADLVVMVGLGLEPRVKQVVEARRLPWRKVVTFDGMEGVIAGGHAEEPGHVHGPECEHGEFDPHIWLDPSAMAAFSERLVEALTDPSLVEAVSPGATVNREMFAKALEDLKTQCSAIDAEYKSALGSAARKTIVTHHNAFEYVARRYGLKVAAVIRPSASVEPTPGEVQAAVSAIREHDLRAIFIEPQFSPASAKRIAEAAGPAGSVKTLTLDPLGEGDWAATMRANLAALVEGLGE